MKINQIIDDIKTTVCFTRQNLGVEGTPFVGMRLHIVFFLILVYKFVLETSQTTR